MDVMTKAGHGKFRPLLAESKGVQRRKYKRNTKGTYISLLASIIQDSPNKMLTFKQIMKRLGAFVSGDRKGLENNIRVCLSSNKCFAKVPVDPECPNANRNFWRVDETYITGKMLRRHFSNSVAMFPGLLPINNETSVEGDPESPVGNGNLRNRPVKFRSSFSIESLLKKDHMSIRDSYQTNAPNQSSQCDVLTFMPNRSVCCFGHFYDGTGTMVRMNYLDEDYKQHNLCSICNPESETTVYGIWKCPIKMTDLSAHHRELCPPPWSYQTFNRSSSSSPPYNPFIYNRSYLRW